MNSKKRAVKNMCIVACGTFLVACGGGAGDESPTSSMGEATDSMVTATAASIATASSIGVTTTSSIGTTRYANYVPLQTAVGTPAYSGPAALGKADSLNHINNARTTCGFGALKQNTILDQVARNHSFYYQSAGMVGDPHYEISGKTGFTGVGPMDRAKYLGYSSNNLTLFENGSYFWGDAGISPNEVYLDLVKDILAVPYHSMLGALSNATEIGLGYDALNSTYYDWVSNTSSTATNTIAYFNFGFGMSGKGQTPPSGRGVRTYPCNGIVDVNPAFWGEWLPYGGQLFSDGRNAHSNPTSSPIYVVSDPGQTLLISSAIVTQASSGAQLSIYSIRTKATDQINAMYYPNDSSGFIWVDKPFVPGQTYDVTINGTSGGKAFIKSFSFKAGKYTNSLESSAKSLGLPT
jgi:uncharacterized protein YkwD